MSLIDDVIDLLDGCNNKRAVQEVDRLLKKQPNFTCAKVLKALALLRMNKSQECTAIIQPIFEETPTEDNTLQALSICYRELEQPEMVCQLYENAAKISQTEDILTHCFMAYVRIGDFQNQYQTAMKLYKMNKKGPYFCWAIMSLLAQAIHNPSSSAARVSLPLAERMMTKYMDDSKTQSEKEIGLFVLILQKQQNYVRLLELIENAVKPTVSTVTGLFHQLKIECLQGTQQLEDLAQYLENSILGRPNEWQYYSEYLSLLDAIGKVRVDLFLRKVLDLYRSNIPPKSTLLAFFSLYDKLSKNEPPPEDALTHLELYLEHYGHKASCFMDIVPFLEAFPRNQLKKLIPEETDFVGTDPHNVNSLRRETNYLHLLRFTVSEKDINVIGTLENCKNLIHNYMKICSQLSKQQLAECSARAELVKLAALHLIDSFWSDTCIWTGLYSILREKSSCTEMSVHIRTQSDYIDKSSEAVQNHECSRNNCKKASDDFPDKTIFRIKEEDFPALICCSILTHGLEDTPACAQLRLILAKLYIRCGAIGAAMDVLQGLDLKYIQIESVGYIYLWKLQQCGFLSEAVRTLKSAKSFYAIYQKESVEHILSAYKYGAWARVLEFAEFRKRLLNSVQSYLVKFEYKLLEYCTEGCSHSQTLRIKRTGAYDIASVPWDDLTDGRDLLALKDCRTNLNRQKWRDTTFRAEKYRLKIRGLLLMLMTDAVGIIQEDSAFQSGVENMMKNIVSLQKELNVDLSQFEVVESITIDGMWPPRISHYVKFGHADALVNFFMLLCNILYYSPSVNMEETVKKILIFFNVKLIEEIRLLDQRRRTLFSILNEFENVYDILETLGFSCILMDVMSYILNKDLNVKETKKRKGKGVNLHATHLQTFVNLQSSIRTCYVELSYQINRQIINVQAEHSTAWENFSSFCELSLGADLSHILSTSLPIVLDKIRESYSKSLEEISSNIKLKLKYLNSLHVQSSS